uniref:Protein panoramix n=1 Tax=Drosophila melanogaster TaxID=7227 RepID=PANX_DROME|nr:panoramix [Drosophila melanogaster]Q9W2H9.1 RecName: Full=Protein panoramix; AltName: Full=Protein silencio [Drosophila melanogaster]AAF46712.1 panoramix [Drosophila melanogaster]AAL28787.1 LD18231p [Drosophila melanogaster]|eukprot:NP_611576.1 panoramix [Drosophila melanogaster]
MEAPMKLEVKVENYVECGINEDEATPLREGTGETPPHAFACGVPMSGSGWCSDPEDGNLVHHSATPTSDEHLQPSLDTIEPKMEPKIKEDADNAMLDSLLADPFENNSPATLQTPADVKPNAMLDSVEQGSRSCELLPSEFSKRENLDDMDLFSLKAAKTLVPDEQQSFPQNDTPIDDPEAADLIAQKREILKMLEMTAENRKVKHKKKKHKKERSHRSNKHQEESRKRNHSNSSSDEGADDKNQFDCDYRGHKKYKNRRGSASSQNESSKERKLRDTELDYVPVRPDEHFIRPIKFSNLIERRPPQVEFNTVNLSKADKRSLAVARAELVLEQIQQKANKEEPPEFHMVDTICKLPVNESFRNQDCFENPSPICNNMNVVYKFNSTPGTRIDLSKWGLETVPEATKRLLRLLGIDVARLKELQSTVKPSQRILKLKKEQLEQGLAPTEEQETATLYKNAATQTERRTATRDAGTQVRLESKLNGAFWQNPHFDPMNLTQHQSNVMLALQEIYQTLPSATMAVKLSRALAPALAIIKGRQP